MKTTVNIDDTVLPRLREEAARTGKTMSELVEAGSRHFLAEGGRPVPGETLQRLPSWRSGGALVDVTDRDALETTMTER